VTVECSTLVTVASVLVLGTTLLAQPITASSVNQLTAEEKAAGWTLLFDGQSWTNWTLSKVPKSTWWKIERGWIRSSPRGSGGGRRLATLESFRDFELQFQWKIAKKGNSGVKYRIQRVWRFQPEHMDTGQVVLLEPTEEAFPAGHPLGFEYQLTDDENAPDAH
jgi:hypothetical protein